jgi:hypothetical protein
MKRRMTAWLLGIGLAAALAGGCSGTVYLDGPAITYLQVTNTTGSGQYVYVDDGYAGWVAPGATVVFAVSWGWHRVEAFLDPVLLLYPIFADCYCYEGLTYYWYIEMVFGAPAAAPEPPADDLCPDDLCPEAADAPAPAAPPAIPAGEPEVF